MAATKNHKRKTNRMQQTNTVDLQSNKRALAGTSQPNTIKIAFVSAEAREVFVARDNNQWNPGSTPLSKDAQDVWRTQLRVPPGRHEYRLVVDDQWQTNPRAAGSIANPYGSSNSVVQAG
jgi:1,4-alpha-glucan branching enzyme